MTRTRRIYNRLRIKKTPRYNLDDGEYHRPIGIPLTRRSHICMGRCCRDPKQEPRTIRRKTEEEFRFQLRHELKTESLTIENESHPWILGELN